MDETLTLRINRIRLVAILSLFIILFGIGSCCLHSYKLAYRGKQNSDSLASKQNSDSVHVASTQLIQDNATGPLWEMLTSVVDNIFGSLFISLGIACIYLFMKSREEQIAVKEGEREIERALNRLREKTRTWGFSGGTGSETRSKTLPSLATKYVKHFYAKDIIVQIIDPEDRKVCANYCVYRSRRDPKKNWDERETVLKLYATILSCLYWSKNSQLQIRLYLKNSFSTQRYDISDDKLIITKENPNDPAYFIQKPSPFFFDSVAEFFETLNMARQLHLNNADFSFKDIFTANHGLTLNKLIEQFQKIGLVNISLTQPEFDQVINFAKPNDKFK